MTALGTDTLLTRVESGRWRGTVGSGWNVGEVPNGGYLMALMVTAVAELARHPHPLTATAHYLARAESDREFELTGHVLKSGRTLSSVEASLHQGGSARIRLLATFGDLARTEGPTVVTGRPPPLPLPADCASPADKPMEIMHRFDYRLPPSSGRPTGQAEIAGWIRLADGRPADLASLAVFADAFPPAVFNLDHFGWVPTIEFTVHFRAEPVPGWLRARMVTRYLINGYLEEDAELWDEAGNLVALSRQLAMVLSGPGTRESPA